MKKLAILVSVATAVPLLFGSGVVALQAATRSVSTARYDVQEVWHATSTTGKGRPTDIYAFQSTLTTPAGKAVGSVDGYMVNLRASVALTATATLPGGTLVLSGAYALNADPRRVVIAGGTGRFANARGTVTLTDAGTRGDLAVVTFER